MGCGSSGHVVPAPDTAASDHHRVGNGTTTTSDHKKDKDEHDDLPTVVLPDTPVKPKPPIAFEIPIDEFDSSRRLPSSPPPHLQRLLQPILPDLTLPDIEEKLAEAETRRLMILQHRAASAQKRAQKMMRSLHEMDILDSEHETTDTPDITKHGTSNTLKLPPEPAAWEDRNI